MKTRKLWLGFIAVMTISFAVLLYYGREIYREAPPIPDKVVASDGAVLFSAQDIKDGQNVWQSTGGQQLGSIWGHGGYQAPDWTADWLHREAEFMINRLAREAYGKDYGDLAEDEKAAVQVRLQQDMRTNTYDPETGLLTISDLRAEAFAHNSAHYGGLFTNDPELAHLRSEEHTSELQSRPHLVCRLL